MADASGTYNYSPSLADFVLYAFGKCGIRRTAVVQEHMADARMAANLVLAEWSNRGVNLWNVALESVSTVQGQIAYSVPANTAMVLDIYLTVSPATSNAEDIILTSISRTDYASIPNKTQQGRPTTFWYDRLVSSTINLWQSPDAGPYTLNYYIVSQNQDAVLPNGTGPGIPLQWFKAFSDALGAELSTIYAPEKTQLLQTAAERSWQLAAEFGTENAPMYINPGLSGYYR